MQIHMIKPTKSAENFKTKDQTIASLLYATGQTLNSSFWENGVCFFVYEDKTQCEQIIVNYYKGQIILSAKTIFDAIKTVKGIIYSR